MGGNTSLEGVTSGVTVGFEDTIVGVLEGGLGVDDGATVGGSVTVDCGVSVMVGSGKVGNGVWRGGVAVGDGTHALNIKTTKAARMIRYRAVVDHSLRLILDSFDRFR